eukprot:750399-Hanusia_phi.AAC.4
MPAMPSEPMKTSACARRSVLLSHHTLASYSHIALLSHHPLALHSHPTLSLRPEGSQELELVQHRRQLQLLLTLAQKNLPAPTPAQEPPPTMSNRPSQSERQRAEIVPSPPAAPTTRGHCCGTWSSCRPSPELHSTRPAASRFLLLSLHPQWPEGVRASRTRAPANSQRRRDRRLSPPSPASTSGSQPSAALPRSWSPWRRCRRAETGQH